MIYEKVYELDKYLIGALQAKYDPPPGFKSNQKTGWDKGSFQEKIEMKDALQIQLKSKGDSETIVNSIKIDDSTNNKPLDRRNTELDFNPRCGYCIGLRLDKTAKLAAEGGFDAFTTTLLESKYQPHDYIHAIGDRLADKYGIKFYYQDFRTSWKESIKISKELELYRQQYCGCIFSEYERYGPR